MHLETLNIIYQYNRSIVRAFTILCTVFFRLLALGRMSLNRVNNR